MVQDWVQSLGVEGVRIEGPEGSGCWVRLRPLTWREALQREALTCSEEFEVDAAGVVTKVVRRYDAEAGARFDLRHCLICGQLPPVGSVRRGGVTEELVARLLGELPGETASWLAGCLEAVNLRRPEDQERLSEVKALVGRAARQGAEVDLRELVTEEAVGACLREGKDFRSQAEWRERQPAPARRVATARPLLHALLADPGFTGEEPRNLSEAPAWWAELARTYRGVVRGG